MARVGREGLGDDEKGVGESLNTPLGLALDSLAEGLGSEVCCTGHLEATSTGDDTVVDDGVVDGPQTVANGILHLCDGVLVGSLDEDSDGLGVLDFLNESELLLAELVLVNQASPSKNIGGQVLNTVLCSTTADKLKTLHVPPLSSPEGENAILDKNIQAQGVNTLLVNNNEALVGVGTADLLLELHDLLQLSIDELAFTLHQLIPLFGRRVVEARVDLRLFVFQTHVQGQDERVLHTLGHVGVSGTVVKSKTTDQSGVRGRAMLHGHDLNHV